MQVALERRQVECDCGETVSSDLPAELKVEKSGDHLLQAVGCDCSRLWSFATDREPELLDGIEPIPRAVLNEADLEDADAKLVCERCWTVYRRDEAEPQRSNLAAPKVDREEMDPDMLIGCPNCNAAVSAYGIPVEQALELGFGEAPSDASKSGARLD